MWGYMDYMAERTRKRWPEHGTTEAQRREAEQNLACFETTLELTPEELWRVRSA
jgi:hypothetical protein